MITELISSFAGEEIASRLGGFFNKGSSFLSFFHFSSPFIGLGNFPLP